MGKRKFISIYFQNGNFGGRKKRDITLAFNDDDPLYEKFKGLGSSKIKEIIGIHSYQELIKKAEKEGRSLGNYIKFNLIKKTEKSE
jgi:hypothetical protein